MKSLSFFYVQVPKVAQMEYPLIRAILIKIVLQRQVISRFQLYLVCFFFFWPNTSLPYIFPKEFISNMFHFLVKLHVFGVLRPQLLAEAIRSSL